MRTSRNLLLLVLLALLAGDAPAQGRRRRPAPEGPAGPDIGDPAPDLRLTDPQGAPVSLSALWSDRPLVLVLGSYSSPDFRAGSPGILKLVGTFPDAIAVAVLYTVEAHPAGAEGPYGPGTDATEANTRAGIGIPSAADLDARRGVARRAQRELDLEAPVMIAVDSMDDAAWNAYGRSPNSAFLIDRGYVVERQARFDPAEMESAVRIVLRARGIAADPAAGPENP